MKPDCTIARHWHATALKRKPTPEHVMTLTDDQIRGVGFTRPKVSFIKDLAEGVIDGRLDLTGL